MQDNTVARIYRVQEYRLPSPPLLNVMRICGVYMKKYAKRCVAKIREILE
jgi:hypothetical protein